MKIIMEPADMQETEVIIRGNLATAEVAAMLAFVNTKNSPNKLTLLKEDEQYFIDPKEVVYFEATDGKVMAKTTQGDFGTKQKLYELKDNLAGLSFAQINKSMLVNIDFVKSVSAEFSGNYSLKLKQGKETLTISRKYWKEFKDKI